MKQIVRLITLIIAMTFIATVEAAAPPAQPKWETVETVVASLSDEHLDVTVQEQYIYVYTPRPTNVKVFTILGQLVSQSAIPAGTSRLKVNTRGLYILKAGSVTRRVTI